MPIHISLFTFDCYAIRRTKYVLNEQEDELFFFPNSVSPPVPEYLSFSLPGTKCLRERNNLVKTVAFGIDNESKYLLFILRIYLPFVSDRKFTLYIFPFHLLFERIESRKKMLHGIKPISYTLRPCIPLHRCVETFVLISTEAPSH